MKHPLPLRAPRFFTGLSSVILFLGATNAIAQPSLTFKRIVNNWPTIELYLTTACNSQPMYINDKRAFSVWENNEQVLNFDLSCPDPTTRCPMSAALLFDVSGSMAGNGIAGIKAAGNVFVDLMDGTTDEAEILFFNDKVSVAQAMTKDRSLLRAALDSAVPSGFTALWDAFYKGLFELIEYGANTCRAVILLSDGMDGSSIKQPADIIALANRNRIPVFAVGFGNQADTVGMSMIATLTGGSFHHASDTTELKNIYMYLSTRILQGNQECRITYQASCPDGGLRSVELGVHNVCNGSDAKVKSYRTPRDTSTFSTLDIRVAGDTVAGGEEAVMPVRLHSDISGQIFNRAAIKLGFDTSRMKLSEVRTAAGDLWHGIPISVFPLADGAQIVVMFKTTVPLGAYPRLLGTLVFATAAIQADSIRVPVAVAEWIFDQGCFTASPGGGEILVTRSDIYLRCSVDPPSLDLSWNSTTGDYDGNPFTVRMTARNGGTATALNGRYQITFDQDAFVFAQPSAEIVRGNPVDVIPGGSSEAQWQLRAKRRSSTDTLRVAIKGIYDNAPSMECFSVVRIPAADPELECSLAVTPVGIDSVNKRYDPMPFAVDLTVRNLSGIRTDTILATLLVPADLRIFGPTGYRMDTRPVMPAQLDPSGTAVVHWTLWHPTTASGKTYTIDVVVRTSSVNSSSCVATVVIPAMPDAGLKVSCQVPDSLHYDETIGAYVPNPFAVSVSAMNTGKDTVSEVYALIMIPPGMMFDTAGTKISRPFVPSELPEYQGGPVPTLSWPVRYRRTLTVDTVLVFSWRVTGKLPSGERIDTLVECRVRVPGVRPLAVDPAGDVPDAFRLDQNVPNPFTATTVIPFQLPREATVTLAIFNALGVRVATLCSGMRNAGNHQVSWDGRDHAGRKVPAGIYFCRLQVGTGSGSMTTRTRAIILRK